MFLIQSMEFKVFTQNPSETRKIGEILAREISNPPKKIVICLEGNLGGGKTTFIKGFAKGLGIREKILSPTFVIMRKFKLCNKKLNFFYHFDCYRIQNSAEILKLGFKKIISDPKNIVVIEWANKIKNILPKNRITLNFRIIDKSKRKIVVK